MISFCELMGIKFEKILKKISQNHYRNSVLMGGNKFNEIHSFNNINRKKIRHNTRIEKKKRRRMLKRK